MTDLKLGKEVVRNHGKQTEPEAITHFQKELLNLTEKLGGDDATVSKNVSHVNFRKLDKELHKSHNCAPAELDQHLHVSGVYKVGGKMQVIFTDDLYKKSGDNQRHAYTINEQTGKIDSVFDMKKTTSGATILEYNKENGVVQSAQFNAEKRGDSNVLTNKDKSYTEYHTADGRTVKVHADGVPTVQYPQSGPTESYEMNANKNYDHKMSNEKGQMETRGAAYEKPVVAEDGTITLKRANIDFTTRQFANGNRAEYTGDPDQKGSMLRITDANGKHAQLEWDEKQQPRTITLTGGDLKEASVMKRYDDVNNIYAAKDGSYMKINIDTVRGTINYEPVQWKGFFGPWEPVKKTEWQGPIQPARSDHQPRKTYDVTVPSPQPLEQLASADGTVQF